MLDTYRSLTPSSPTENLISDQGAIALAQWLRQDRSVDSLDISGLTWYQRFNRQTDFVSLIDRHSHILAD